jgi:hypothetical protein
MATARIFKRPKNTTQSGKFRTELWQLEYEPGEQKKADPLTGWAGSGDTSDQVRLTFPSQEAAIAFCEREGIDFHVVPTPTQKLQLQSYADNFR